MAEGCGFEIVTPVWRRNLRKPLILLDFWAIIVLNLIGRSLHEFSRFAAVYLRQGEVVSDGKLPFH